MAETNPYDAVIADLEARRTALDNFIESLKRLREGFGTPNFHLSQLWPEMGAASPTIAVGTPKVEDIPSDAFFNMTIVDAAIKFLGTWAQRKPQSTKAIMEAFERGGLKGKAYATIYGVLNRRENKVHDIVNVHGDWGLGEWYGAKPKRKPVSLRPSDFEQDEPEHDAEPLPPEKAEEKAPA